MTYRPNRRFTLANHLPRHGNQWARAAGIRFIQALQAARPVLMIEGRPGTGKTHLLHALVNLAARHEAIESSSCLSAVQFAEEVVRGDYHADLDDVLRFYSAECLLAIDDVDRLFYQSEVADALMHVLRVRVAEGRRTLLAETRCQRPRVSHALVEYLAAQPTVIVH